MRHAFPRAAAARGRAADEGVLPLDARVEEPREVERRARRAAPRARGARCRSAPTVPGLGGTITSAPVCRATAAASASALKGIPWQKTTSPTERLPFTRFR